MPFFSNLIGSLEYQQFSDMSCFDGIKKASEIDTSRCFLFIFSNVMILSLEKTFQFRNNNSLFFIPYLAKISYFFIFSWRVVLPIPKASAVRPFLPLFSNKVFTIYCRSASSIYSLRFLFDFGYEFDLCYIRRHGR